MKTGKSKKLKTIDLFAGCGGLTEGFELSGEYSTIGLVEWDRPSLKTLINRLNKKWGYRDAESMALHFDMQRTKELLNGWENDPKYSTNKGLKSLIEKKEGDVDVIVGGPPCQAYSVAGRVRDKDGMKNDYRNYLFETYLEVVKEFQPKAFVFENVLGLLSAKPEDVPIPDLIKSAFKKIGYEVIDDLKNTVVDASEYGVPQYRKRLVIVGLRKDAFEGKDIQHILTDFYKKILPSHKQQIKTVGDAIYDLPKIKPLNKKEATGSRSSHQIPNNQSFLNHTPRFHNTRDIEIFKELAEDLHRKNRKYKTIDDLKKLYTEKTGKKSNIHKYYVLELNKPSNTIVAHLHKDGLRHIHPDPEQARSITVREAARLQSFPDDFEFLGGMGDQYKMIGNAVPPLLAKAIADSLKKLLNKYYPSDLKSAIIDFDESPTAKIRRVRVCS